MMGLGASWVRSSSAHELGSVRPIKLGPSSHILSPSVAPFTLWVRHRWVEGLMGWQSQARGMMVWLKGMMVWLKGMMGWYQRDDGVKLKRWRSNPKEMMVWTRTPWTAPTSDKLSGSHYEAWHASPFDWILSRIEASLRLPCTSPINTRVFLSHFSIFS